MATARKKLEIAKPEDFDGMTLMHITSSNMKRIRIVDIGINEPLTLIGGDNAQGKSSLLDSVQWVFARKDDIQADPISHGKQEGSVVVQFGDGETVKLKVTKTFLRVGEDDFKTETDIEIPGSLPPSRVQEFLAQLTGGIGFDPVAFDLMKDSDQFDSLKRFVPDFDFKANKEKHDALFKDRTDINRDLKRMQAAAESVAVSEKAPCARVDEQALTLELQQAGEKNVDRARRQKNRDEAEAKIESLGTLAASKLQEIDIEIGDYDSALDTQIADINAEIDRLQAKKDKLEGEAAAKRILIRERLTAEADAMAKEAGELRAALESAEPLAEYIDTAELAKRLDAGRGNNKALSEWESARDRRKQYQDEAAELAKQSEDLTAQIVDCQQEKQQAILKAHLPVDGLGFGDGFVTLGGVPWRQASHAERIDASTAIAMALSPRLKVILIRDGSNLGSKMRERIRERAAAGGYRVLMEVVDDVGDQSHVYISDGAVSTAGAAEAAQ